MFTVISTVVIGLIVLSLLVVIHEAGHTLAARRCGVRVTEFFLGMPCRFRFARRSKKYGTLVGVTPILLGGYTRICGMEGEEDERLADVFACVSRHGRVRADALAEEVGCSVEDAYAMLATLADWAAIEPYYDPALGEDPNQSDWPAAFQTLARDAAGLTIYDVGSHVGEPGSTEAGEPRAITDSAAALAAERSHTYLGCSFGQKLLMLVAGPFFNLVLAVLLMVVALSGIGYQAADGTTLASVTEGSLADDAGIQAGDTVTSIDGTEVTTWDELGTALDEAFADEESFEVSWTHDGEQRTATITPSDDDQVLGITVRTKTVHANIVESISYSFQYAVAVVQAVIQLIIPTQTMEVLNQSTSIVGIAVISQRAAMEGLADLLMIMPAISMSLCFMNLLPIPPLDGGKVLIEIINLIRRKPLSKRAELVVSYIGIAFFLFVFIYVLRLDIIRFVMG